MNTLNHTETLNERRTSITKISGYAFLIIAGIYLFYRVSRITTFHFPWPGGFEKVLLWVLLGLALIRLMLMDLRHYEILGALILAATCFLVYNSDGYLFLPFLTALYVGMIGINYRKILKAYLLFAGPLFCLAVFNGWLGAIDNYVYTEAGEGLRSAWGIIYPTDFVSFALFLLMVLWVTYTKIPDVVMLLLSLLHILLSYFIAHSSNSVICGILFFCVILYRRAEERIIMKKPGLSWIKKGMDPCLTISFPVCAFIMFYFCWLYSSGSTIGKRLDMLMSGRLFYATRAFQEYGLSLFGTPFQQTGAGGAVAGSTDYFYVDSSYPLILIRYGTVLFLLFCLLWIWQTRKAIRIGDRRLALVLGLIAIHSFGEQHFAECWYNIFLLIPFAGFMNPGVAGSSDAPVAGSSDASVTGSSVVPVTGYSGVPVVGSSGVPVTGSSNVPVAGSSDAPVARSIDVPVAGSSDVPVTGSSDAPVTGSAGNYPGQKARNRRWIPLGYLVIVAFLAFFLAFFLHLPEILSDWKTVLELRRLCGGGESSWRLLLATILFSIPIVLIVPITIRMSADIRRPFRKLALKMSSVVLILICLAGGMGEWLYLTEAADTAAEQDKASLEPDREALQLCLEAAEGDVYSTLVPGLYQREMEGMDSSLLFEDDLARLSRCTVLVPSDTERPAYLTSGFLFTKITEDHALLSNDMAVLRALAKAGYHSTGYYSEEKSTDLKAASESYGLEYSEQSGLKLRGKKHSLRKGPYVDLYSGTYTATFDLRLPEETERDTQKYATIRIVGNKGKAILQEREIQSGQFDEDGRLTVTMRFWTPGVRNAAFRVYMEKKNELYVESIRYVRSPDNDIHSFYNEDHRLIRQEIFSLEGEPILTPQNYFAVDYAYDRDGNVIQNRYYDQDGNLTMTTWGYAGIDRAFDSKKQLIQEAYFGTEDEPLALPAGYAGVSYEYDRAGNRIRQSYYGLDGELTVISSGYAEVRREFDRNRHVVREEYYDANGRLYMQPAWYAVTTLAYDDEGNAVRQSWLDAEGNPVKTVNGYAGVVRSFDGESRVTREEYYGEDEALCLLPTGYAIREWDYDENGNAVAERYYDTARNLTVTTYGYAEIHRQYDGNGKILQESYYGKQQEPCLQAGGYAGLSQRYDVDGRLIERVYLDQNGLPIQRTDGYVRAEWVKDPSSDTMNLELYDEEDREIDLEEKNLAMKTSREWSAWMTPARNVVNSCFTVSSANLGEKAEGDTYTCQLEIEFRDVSVTPGLGFGFWSQGAADGRWDIGNVWNSALIHLDSAPVDGIIFCISTQTLNENMAHASTFDLGFRCDNWATGAFRVRCVKVEKGNEATEWSPGV